MPFAIRTMTHEHLAGCAALASERYRFQRVLSPDLPPHYENPDALLPRITELAAKAPGVVAHHDGRMAGFLMGELIRPFGRRSGQHTGCAFLDASLQARLLLAVTPYRWKCCVGQRAAGGLRYPVVSIIYL